MAAQVVDSADITLVAAALRERGGTQELLTWPNGFVQAIGDLSPQMAAADLGKYVAPDGSGGFELRTQTERTVYDNGTYETPGNNSVIVAIPPAAGNSY